MERTPLARLRMDEQIMERRRQNVTNFGSAWLKPPGVPKTLFQMREERREAEEHAEAMRREQELAAQLAEAEADAVAGVDVLDDEHMVDGEEEPDLDDEIPEAEGFGFDGDDSDEEDDSGPEEEEDDDDETDEEGDGTTNNAGAVMVSPAERRDMRDQVRDMRATEDRVREVMAQGQEGGGLTIIDDAVDADDRAEMLEEDDLVHDYQDGGDARPGDMSVDMDMDADLDDDVPEEHGRYEHTDSEADISDDNGTRDVSFASAGRAPQASRFRRSLPRSSARGSHRGSLAQSEIDLSGFLSRDESSYLASSPQMRRRG